MPPTLPTVFDKNRYIHKSEPFNIIRGWFSQARVSTFASVRDFVLNSSQVRTAMPIADDGDFHTEIESAEIPYLLYMEAQRLLNKALSNFCAQLYLHRAGYLSWGIVTNYYSSFFSLSGLIRLQGKARIATQDMANLPRGFFLSSSRTATPHCVIFPHWGNHHEQTCLDFLFSYRRFNILRVSFEDLLSLTRDELINEVKWRNTNNYDLQNGFRELESPAFRRRDLETITAKKVNTLPSLVTTPHQELAYMARTCARLILLASTSWRIARGSAELRMLFDKYQQNRERVIDDIYGKNTEMGRCLLRFTRGRMKLT